MRRLAIDLYRVLVLTPTRGYLNYPQGDPLTTPAPEPD